MYRYDEFDHKLVNERVAQFRRQVQRRLDGEITEDQFKPLRLMNGLYLQLHAYMLRVNVPYGTLSSRQLHKFADIARKPICLPKFCCIARNCSLRKYSRCALSTSSCTDV